jgi:hypothetical protein
MIPKDELGLERELRRAMADEVARLGMPRTDLGAIRRRTATRRRVLIPAVVGLVGIVIAGPFALARSDVNILPKLAGSVVPRERGAQPAASGGAPAPGGAQAGPRGVGSVPRVSGGDGSAPAPAPALACVTGRGPLPAVERAALVRDASGVLRTAQGTVDRTLGTVERLSFATGTADKLVPAAGSIVRLVTCGDRVGLAPVERTAILGQVRQVVRTSAVVAAGVVRQTVGRSQVDAVTPVGLAVVQATPRTVVVAVALGGGPVPDLGTVMVTMGLTDGKVAQVDMSGLDLGGLGGGLLGSSPVLDLVRSLDLAKGLESLDGLAGIGGLVPDPAGVLAKDVTIVPPLVR